MVQRWLLRVLAVPIEQENIRHYVYWHDGHNDDPIIQKLLAAVREVVVQCVLSFGVKINYRWH